MAKTSREGVKSTVYMVVNEEPQLIDWEMPYVIWGVHVGLGGQGPFPDHRPSDHMCTRTWKCRSD